MNPHPPDLESGALAVRATGLKKFLFILTGFNLLFGLFMKSVSPARATIFFHFQFFRRRLFVFCAGVISALTFIAC